MITEKQLERIRLLSDETLYKEAIDLMHSIGTANSLPPTQINGLLNVSLANTYNRLLEFVEHQRHRTTWNRREQRYIPDDTKHKTKYTDTTQALSVEQSLRLRGQARDADGSTYRWWQGNIELYR